jgi:hypothetical protein
MAWVRDSFKPICNPPFAHIVAGRHFHLHPVANTNPNVIFAHFAADPAQNDAAAVVQSNLESVADVRDHHAGKLN